MCHLLKMRDMHHACLRGLTPAGAQLLGACRHGIDQVPAHAVREAAADLRQARRNAERNAQWPPQSEASEDVVLPASQSAAEARQHSKADGSLEAAASSFKAGPLDQVSPCWAALLGCRGTLHAYALHLGGCRSWQRQLRRCDRLGSSPQNT